MFCCTFSSLLLGGWVQVGGREVYRRGMMLVTEKNVSGAQLGRYRGCVKLIIARDVRTGEAARHGKEELHGGRIGRCACVCVCVVRKVAMVGGWKGSSYEGWPALAGDESESSRDRCDDDNNNDDFLGRASMQEGGD